MNKNQRILANFISSIIKVIAKNASYDYGIAVLKKYIESKSSEYDFLKYINLETISTEAEKIKIQEDIKNIEKEDMSRFINDFIDNLFPYLFIQLLVKEMDKEMIKDLEELNVKL